MTKVIVNLVGDKENLKTPAVTIDKARRGHSGYTELGKEQEVPAKTYTATIYSDGKVYRTKEVTVPVNDPVTLSINVDQHRRQRLDTLSATPRSKQTPPPRGAFFFLFPSRSRMASSFFHGITTTIIDSGPRPTVVLSSSMIGLVDTYTPGADLTRPDVLVQITNPREAMQAFGQNSAIPRTINAIYVRTSAVIVGMDVAKTDDANALTSGITGGIMPGYAPVCS